MLMKITFAAAILMVISSSSANAQQAVVYRPFVAAPVAPAPIVVARPLVAPSPPVLVAPSVTSYRVPVTVYSPAVPAVTVVAPTTTTPVIVRPKVYIPGRPIRNFFEAITP